MKIFLAGGTGVLGRRVLPLLLGAGHEVTAVARTSASADALRRLGASPVAVDLFDAAALRGAVTGHEVVCNLATHIPGLTHGARAGAWAENDRIRTVGSRNLVDAAIAAGAARFVQESIAFRYADGGDRWIDEEAALAPSALTASVADAEASAARFSASGGVGVVLRLALLYGPDASHTRSQLRLAREGIAPVLGSPNGFQTMVHLDDAASAVVAALRAPAGVYNVCEDRPGTRAAQADAIARALGSAPLWMAPAVLARAGGSTTAYLARSLRVSNRRLREATGWAPRYPDPRTGWAAVIAETGLAPGGGGRSAPAGELVDGGGGGRVDGLVDDVPGGRVGGGGVGEGGVGGPAAARRRRLLVRASLLVLCLGAASVGVWATFMPLSFFRSFPGGGRHWVAAEGPYNLHLITDVGALSLGLLVLTVAALGSHSRALVRTAGIAWVVSALPHLMHHVAHRAVLSAGDQAASLAGIGLQVALGALCAVLGTPPWANRGATPPAGTDSASETGLGAGARATAAGSD